MRKKEELGSPFSCFNRANDTERIFVLLGRDVAAPGTIRRWIELRISLGKNRPDDPQILEAAETASLMEKERK
jgi:hypothetical protein